MATERLLRSLNENKAVFVVIGATAFPAYGYARATLDIDLFVKPTRPNIRRVMKSFIHPFVKGVVFEDIWKNKITSKIGKTKVYFPSLEDMIRMKKAAGRAKDREDLKFLKKLLKMKIEVIR